MKRVKVTEEVMEQFAQAMFLTGRFVEACEEMDQEFAEGTICLMIEETAKKYGDNVCAVAVRIADAVIGANTGGLDDIELEFEDEDGEKSCSTTC